MALVVVVHFLDKIKVETSAGLRRTYYEKHLCKANQLIEWHLF